MRKPVEQQYKTREGWQNKAKGHTLQELVYRQ